uniref:Nucleophosmin n=1 Tax=Chlorocebus sabaeus TaxID=60711 RepID=A0A0D9RWS4_CHLSB
TGMYVDTSPLRPQNYLFGCELKADKDYHFRVDNDENEHQLFLRTVSLGPGAKDELDIVEEQGGNPIKVTLAALKMSVQPTVSLGGFEITPLVILWLKCGSEPVHISGYHLAVVEEDAESQDEEEDVRLLSISGKQPAPGSSSKFPQKKVKRAADKHDGDDKDNDNDDKFDDEETEEKAPVKKSVQDTPKNAQKSNQNGKDSKPSSTPRTKGQEFFIKQEKSPKTPKGPSSIEDIKAKQANVEKGGSLPKMEAKFFNYVKNCFWRIYQEAIQDLWQWRK